MTTINAAPPSPGTPAGTRRLRGHLAGVVRQVSRAVTMAGTTAAKLVARAPGTIHATRAGARNTTSALQTLPDQTLRWLAATSVGLGAGFYVAGAPRVVIAAGVAPAVIMGAAIALRPIEPVIPTAERASGSSFVPTVGIENYS
jgi:hypothetical protein